MKVRDKEITRGVKSQVGGRVETGGEGALDSSGCDFDDRAGASAAFATNRLPARSKARPLGSASPEAKILAVPAGVIFTILLPKKSAS